MSDLYTKGLNQILRGNIDFANDGFSLHIVDTNIYTPDLDLDESLSDVPTSAILSTVSLAGAALSGSSFTADSAVFPAVEGGEASAFILTFNADTYSGSHLIAIIDDAPELPITPDGTDITVNWDAEGIFRL